MPSPKKKTEPELKPEPEAPKEIALYGQLADQYKLPIEEARKLIRSESPLTDNAILQAIFTAKFIGVPLQGINVIPSKQGAGIYVNAVGVRYKYHTDPRGFKCASAEILQVPKVDGDLTIVKGRVEFQDGSYGENIGAVIVDNRWNLANALMKAATKAIRRAGQDAVELTAPIYEDYIEYREEQMKDITPEAQMLGNGNDEPTNVTQFMKKVIDAKLDPDTVCQMLGVAQITQVKDYGAAWAKVKPTEGTP